LSGYYGGIVMQKNMTKAIGIFTLVLLVLSMTGAAASTCSLIKAHADSFQMTPTKHCGNVMGNDQGTGKKVVSISKCSNGGKVTMKSNGNFCYTRATCSTTGTIVDSFTYKIKNSCGKTSTARVTIHYKCH
jgi:hypothetical protein